MTSIDTGPAWIPPDLGTLAALTDEPDREIVAKPEEAATAAKEFAFFGDDGFSFSDILDIVNPLQHIPLVGTLYRALTGDEIAPGPRMAGGALFGGPIGAALATANAVLGESTGKDAGEHVLALFEDEAAGNPADAPVTVAAATQSYAAPDLAALAPLPTPTVAAPAKRETVASAEPESLRSMPVAAIEAALVASKGEALTMEAIANPPGVGSDTPPDNDRQGTRSHVPAGTDPAAPEGWFSAAMMTALSRYEETRGMTLAQSRPTALSASY